MLHLITGLDNGGAEAVLFRLVAADVDAGVGSNHYVISLMDAGVYAEKFRGIGIPVDVLGFPRGRLTFKGVVKLFKIIRRIRPDMVQTWMYHADLVGGVVARMSGVRTVVWGIRHANLNPEHNSRSTLLVVRLCAALSGWVPKRIISCSEKATRLHQAAGYRADKFLQIPNGYNMERFKPDPSNRSGIRAELNVAEDAFVLGMVARFDVQKNHRNLIDALGLLKRRGIQFTCLLVGARMDESNSVLRDWIEEAAIGDHVKLLGPRDDVPAVMNALDVHVLSSLGEAFPNVLAEAMACGTPCVTTDVGDAAVIVKEHGWVVKPRDAAALADGLMEAYGSFSGDKAAWKARQAACRAHIIANFGLEQMCERYRQAWQACIQV